jgi:RNA polymerase sigma factor (sigma-70 family)
MSPTPPGRRVLHHLRRVLPSSGAGPSDRELLERFAAGRDEAAFADVVHRHGPLVLGVCRRVLGNGPDAEDAFQATFLVLARKAGAIRWQDSVAHWLHAVASRLARQARAAALRRRRHEGQAALIPRPEPLPQAAWQELHAVLDEELLGLPEKYRLPLLLCYLRGRRREDVARELGWSLRTLDRRLEQGRDRLRLRLVRRGLAVSSGVLATALAVQPTDAAPAAWADATVRAACGGRPSESVAGLADGFLRAGSGGKTRLALLVLLSGLALAGVGLAARQTAPVPPAPADTPSSPQPPAAEAERVDAHGDPLPAGARVRLGTTRFSRGSNPGNLGCSADGKLLASGGDSARLLDARTGRVLRPLPGGGSVALSPDGKLVAVRGLDQGLRVLETATGKEVWSLPGDPRYGRGKEISVDEHGFAAFSPDGKLLASGGWNKVVEVYEAGTGKSVASLAGHKGPLQAGAFSPDGKLLATASRDATVGVWDVAQGKVAHVLKGHKSDVYALAFSPDGKVLASGSRDLSLKLWDPASGQEVRPGLASGTFYALAFGPDGKTLACAGDRGEVTLFDVSANNQRPAMDNLLWQWVDESPAGVPGVPGVAFSPDGKTVFSGGARVRVLDAATGKAAPLEGATRGLIMPTFSPDGKTVATGGAVVRLWDSATGKPGARLTPAEAPTSGLAFLPDGKALLVSERTGANLWQLPDLKESEVLRKKNAQRPIWVQRLAVSADGGTAVLDVVEDVVVVDVVGGKELHRFGVRTGHGLAVSPDGKLVALVRGDRKLSLWDTASGKELRTLDTPGQWMGPLAFGPGGAYLATAGADIRLWELRSGKEALRLEGTPPMAFSPDGRLLALARGREAVVYDLAAGREVKRLTGHDELVVGLAFAPDGDTVATSSMDTTALLWDVKAERRAAAGARPLTERELEAAWAGLKSSDAGDAFRALGALASSGQAAKFLKERLPPAGADQARLKKLLAELDSPKFEVREQAQEELEGLEELAAPALRKALEGTPAAEVRRRVEGILAKIQDGAWSGEGLRRLRAVEVLERAGGPDERKLLEELAAGAEEARTTREARAARRRLE